MGDQIKYDEFGVESFNVGLYGMMGPLCVAISHRCRRRSYQIKRALGKSLLLESFAIFLLPNRIRSFFCCFRTWQLPHLDVLSQCISLDRKEFILICMRPALGRGCLFYEITYQTRRIFQNG